MTIQQTTDRHRHLHGRQTLRDQPTHATTHLGLIGGISGQDRQN
jgi:hypothetical protein